MYPIRHKRGYIWFILSKFCAIRDRSKIIEPLLESYLQVLVTTSLNGFTSYLLAIV